MLAVLLTSPVLGLDNLAASVAVGLQRPGWHTRAFVALLFAGLAALAILVGSGLGAASAEWLGPSAQYAGGVILVSLGAYQLWQQRDHSPSLPPDQVSPWSLVLVGLGVSVDTTVAGVAFGLRGDPILASAAVVGVVTGLMSAECLELGGYIGGWSSRVARRIAPAALVAVGLGIATGLL